MHDVIYQEVAKCIQWMDPYKELSDWLNELEKYHRKCWELFNNSASELYNLLKKHHSYIGVLFRPTTISSIFQKIVNMKAVLQSDFAKNGKYTITHADLETSGSICIY
jgi:(p)ppGpp synthase/HD superfamily hydrolase